MTGNLRVTPEKLISTSTQFGQSDSKVNTLTQSMMDIANQLNSTWAGEAATGYYTKLKGLQADMQKLHKMIQEHTTDLQEMAKTYQEAEKANVQTANALKTNEIV
ncbi:WXG100 family type VII secretion target [Pseudoflavonifractor sp. 60]|uniref:WXG100 family type VII secretion target n=1 Tax=Pseudoflavonifractor sp. 60 TaxID=2304576 RepID=UPI0013694BCF|nr:WXG100 family type VII secretion target [Pseudoflavonifractor sp. 60]NBI65381.1 WXG100 family type VII secretion target [Pseudoflavonifractor sp. 60]